MKADIAEKWITALRSGEYTQATDALRDEMGGFCCLGVLCDLYRQETGAGKWDGSYFIPAGGEPTAVDYSDDIDGVLPPFVQKWAGTRTAAGFYDPDITKQKHEHTKLALTQANDKGANFFEIADIIEQNKELL